MGNISGIQAVAMGKCPRCRKGNMYKKHILNPFSLTNMNANCTHCGLTFQKEPGFYYGSMYFSYALSVGLFLIIGFSLYYFFGDPETWIYLTSITAIVLLIFPFNFKYSRVLWLHFFGDEKYQEKYAR